MLLKTMAEVIGIARDPATRAERGRQRPHPRPNAPRSVAVNVRPAANVHEDTASGNSYRLSASSTLVDVMIVDASWTIAPRGSLIPV